MKDNRIIRYILDYKKIKKWNHKYIISRKEYNSTALFLKLFISLIIISSVVFVSILFNYYNFLAYFFGFYFLGVFVNNFAKGLGGVISTEDFDSFFWLSFIFNNSLYFFYQDNSIHKVKEFKNKDGINSVVIPSGETDLKYYYLNYKLHCLKHAAIKGTAYSSFDYEVEDYYIDGVEIENEEKFKEIVKQYKTQKNITNF